ncbi:MAG: DUF1501 domain-containing protein [Planctomycetales bacterium]
MQPNHASRGDRQPQYSSRREMLMQAGAGFGAIALAGLLAGDESATAADQASRADSLSDSLNPLAPKSSRLPGSAKSVIFLVMEGGPSQLDSFDPKPLLRKLAGKPLPKSFKRVILPMGEIESPILPDKRQWKQHGESGLWISDWLPHTAKCADDLAVIRSLWGNGLNHSNGVCQMNTGQIFGGRPSLGAWVSYGLGTVNQNLPAFVVMEDNPGKAVNGPRNWSAGFMPAVYQGISLQAGNEPIPNLNPPAGIPRDRQEGKLAFLDSINRRHASSRGTQTELEARIKSYELAYRMQAHAPEVVDLSQETAETKSLYGIGKGPTDVFGRNCLMARRLVERGVRFVQLYHGAGSKWDAHKGIESNHGKNFGSSDQPVAALLKDLKRRGMLDDTLVVWGGEFGRTPMSEKGDGRDHNPYGFTMWLAGGGVQGGQVIGSTDEAGFHAVEDRLHIHDFHATILRLLGLDNMKLTYTHKGRPERPTLNEGQAHKKIVG